MDNLTPLAERLRPNTFENYIGQQHLIGEGCTLRNFIEKGIIPSMIFWGPPGVGKTTLANIIANYLKRPFYTLSAINSGVKDVREVIEKAKSQQFFGTNNPVLFIDEIHRFSKSQQDSLLGAVEKGTITLIGATTENPSFEVISALLSRCQVYILKEQTKEDLLKLIDIALTQDEFLKKKKVVIKEYESLLQLSGGDARKLLNTLEIVINSFSSDIIEITNDIVVNTVQQNLVRYDKTGDQHYDIISAFIKSIRGSDPNAAVYWLARMLEGGEDPKFIARRLLILSSEDIGNANPTALVIANNCFQAINVIGMPEARIILSQAAVYLATSPKSNASYAAINIAQELVRKTGNLSIPLHLRNAPTKLMKDIGYGSNYKYSHGYEGNFEVQEYLPDEIKGTTLFEPGNNPKEASFRNFLKDKWKDKYNY
ncbi:replication-associated recombination protein A [Vicingus serpentipes]|uniref:Replication-associated recombination protein A n=1 Tax=Vicingus serpentipes TaxID=1926625 RepID=A0A5C6RST9_9FLAO|nr:replication-associated recombination protein A [Vicingus serpentipes]TXB65323.1 replication-associated recombination protein A [Vicingus serpentipes]